MAPSVATFYLPFRFSLSYWAHATDEYQDLASQALVLLLSGEDVHGAWQALEEVILYDREKQILDQLDCQYDFQSVLAMDIETISTMCLEICSEFDNELKQTITPVFLEQIRMVLQDPMAYIKVSPLDQSTLCLEVRHYDPQ